MRFFTRKSVWLCVAVAAMMTFGLGNALRAQSQKPSSSLHFQPQSSSLVLLPPDTEASLQPSGAHAYPSLYNWIPKSGVYFHPNVGQTTYPDGIPASEVRFIGSSKGMQLFFTDRGLSYVWVKDVSNYSKEKRTVSHHDVERAKKDIVPVVNNAPADANLKTNLAFEAYRMDMELIGANPAPKLIPGKQTEYYNNYYLGGRVPNQTHVHAYRMLTYENVYPNIDLVFYGNGDYLKYDFVIKPGGNPADIRIRYNGATSVTTDAEGNLKVVTPFGDLTEKAPFCYQSIRPETKASDGPALVSATYAVSGNEVRFNLPRFDAKRLLVIDPNLQWSTYYGGTGTGLDIFNSVIGENNGNSYTVGITATADFPRTVGPVTLSGQTDGVVVRLDNAGARLWGTYYGGNNLDGFGDVVLDASGNVYMSGFTQSTDLTLAGTPAQPVNRGGLDWMMVRMNNAGTVTYATYLGGSRHDHQLVPIDGNLNTFTIADLRGPGIAIDGANRIVMAGNTLSADFAGTPGSPFQTSHASPPNNANPVNLNDVLTDVAVVRFTNEPSPLLDNATYLGGNSFDFAYSVAVDGSNNILVGGTTYSANFWILNAHDTNINDNQTGSADLFVTKLSESFNLLWSTYYGGEDDESPLGINAAWFSYSDITTDMSGSPIITGSTTSTTGIATTGAFRSSPPVPATEYDVCVAKFSAVGGNNSLVWGTYLGGTAASSDVSRSVSCTQNNRPVIGGFASTNDFPTTGGSYQTALGGNADGYVTILAADGSDVDYSTFLGGNNFDETNGVYVDRDSRVYAVGRTASTSAFLTGLTFQGALSGSVDGYIARFAEAGVVDAPCNGRSNGQPIKIVILQYGVDLTEEYVNTLAALDRYVSNYTLTPTPTTDPVVLNGLLATADVLIIPEIEDPAVNFAVFTSFGPNLNAFANSGKTIIALGSNNITGTNFQQALQNTGLFNITNTNSNFLPAPVTIATAITPLTNGVPSQFDMASINVNYQETTTISVIENAPNVAVGYRIIGSGKAVLIGADYSSYDQIMARILANAVNWVGNGLDALRMTVSYTKQDVKCDNSALGSIDVTVMNVASPVTYAWSNGAVSQDLSNLNAGTYTVTISGGRGGLCTEVMSVTINGCQTCGMNQYSVELTANPQDQCAPAAPVTITSKEIKGCGDYDIKTVPFALLNPPVSAINLTNDLVGDRVLGPLPIGFPLDYFCKKYSSIYVSQHGFITLNERENLQPFNPQTIPNTRIPNNVIALGWSNLENPTGNVRYWVEGTAPNRKLVIDYENLNNSAPCTGTGLRGQIIIYEGDSIEFQVQRANLTGGGAFCNFTQGLENHDGTRAAFVAGRNRVGTINIANEARRFVPKTNSADIAYEWRLNPNPAVIGTNANLTHTPPNSGVNTYELKVINSARNCSTSKTINVTVNPATVGGTVSPAQTLCQGQPVGVMTLAGHTGDVVRWESAPDGTFTTPTTISATTTTLQPMMLTQSTCFRAVVQSPGCATQNSAHVCITVNPGAVPGTVSADQTICAGNAPAQFTLSGHTGTIVRWETARDLPFTQNLTTVNNTNPTYTSPALTTTTCFRAVLQAGSCPEVFSAPACVVVDQAPVAGTLTAAQTICAGATPAMLTLTGMQGNVVRWESSIDNFANITTINVTTTTFTPAPPTQTICFRAVVGNGSCPNALSNNVCITVDPVSVGGTVSGAVTVCGVPNTGNLTLAGHTGNVVRWEQSTDNFATKTDLNITQPNFTFVDLTTTTCFRAVVKSGVCAEANSSQVCVTVNQGTTPGTLSGGNITVCSGNNSGNLTLTGNTGSVIRWETAPDVTFSNITTVNSTVTTLPYNNLTQTICFRAQVQNTGCPIQPSNTQCITVDQPSVPGTVGTATTVCGGTNSGNITLTGQTGNVVQWESSTDNWVNVTTINSTTTTLPYNNLTVTTCYRARVKNGSCNGVTQITPVCITVSGGSVGGTVSTSQTVCSGNNVGNLVLSGETGNVVRWEASTDNFATVTNISNVTNNLTFNNVTQTTCFRAVVKSGSCPEANATPACLTVSPVTVPGTLAGGNVTVCSGAAAPNITLSGQTGNVVRWESAPNSGFSTPTTIANVTNAHAPGVLTETTCFRAVVQSGACAEANTVPSCITVSPPTVPGTLTGDATICSGGNAPDLLLTGNTGNVIRWESSTNSFATVTTINSTTTNLPVTGLTQATCYRAVVQSGACAPANSNTVCVAVTPLSVGGTVSANQTLCAGGTPTDLTLAGQTGNVVRWESSTNCAGGVMNAPINSVPNVTTTLIPGNLTQTTCYRAVVQSGTCAEANSNVVTITILPATVGGTATAPQTICRGASPNALILTGHTGSVLGWEVSNDCPNFTTFTTLSGNTPVLALGALTTTSCYRAVVRSGSCTTEKSAPVTISVSQPSLGGTVLGIQTICAGQAPNQLTLTAQTGNVIRWESSTDCGFSINTLITPVATTTTTFSPPALTTTTCFRAIVQNAPCPAAPSAPVQVKVDQASAGGTVFTSRTVCKGANSGPLVLGGAVGNVLYWESSTDCNLFTNASNLGNAGMNTYTSGPLTQTTCFRAVVKNGVCNTAFSVPAKVSISTLSATYQVTHIAGCLLNGTIKATATGGTGGYYYSIAPPVQPPNNTGLFSNLQAGMYTVTVKDGAGCQVDSLIEVRNDDSDVQITRITPGGNFVLITWNPKPGPGVTYTYRYRLLGSNDPWVVVSNVAGTFAFIQRLDMYTPYEFQIRYNCKQPAYSSSFADTIFTTLETANCYTKTVPPPGGIYVQHLTATRAVLRFRYVTGAAGHVYSFGPMSQNRNAWPQHIICDPQDSVEINNLRPNTLYGFRMRALCDNCENISRQKMSDYGNIKQFQTPPLRVDEWNENLEATDWNLSVYPNPNKGNFNLSIEGTQDETISIRLYDLTGRTIYQAQPQLQNGINDLPVEINQPAAGVYLMEVRKGDQVRITKVMVD
jgi:hypothetical protein